LTPWTGQRVRTGRVGSGQPPDPAASPAAKSTRLPGGPVCPVGSATAGRAHVVVPRAATAVAENSGRGEVHESNSAAAANRCSSASCLLGPAGLGTTFPGRPGAAVQFRTGPALPTDRSGAASRPAPSWPRRSTGSSSGPHQPDAPPVFERSLRPASIHRVRASRVAGRRGDLTGSTLAILDLSPPTRSPPKSLARRR